MYNASVTGMLRLCVLLSPSEQKGLIDTFQKISGLLKRRQAQDFSEVKTVPVCLFLCDCLVGIATVGRQARIKLNMRRIQILFM